MTTKNPLICVLSVDYGVDECANVDIYYNDQPDQLAEKFITENSLDASDMQLRLALTTHINSNFFEARTRYDQQIAERAARKSQAVSKPPSSPLHALPPPILESRKSSPSKSESISPFGNRSRFSEASRESEKGQRAMVGSEEELSARYDAIAQSVASLANSASANVPLSNNSRKHTLNHRSSTSSNLASNQGAHQIQHGIQNGNLHNQNGSQASRRNTESSLQKSATSKLARPPPIPVSKMSVLSTSSNSELYDRLYKEAEEKAKRSAELTIQVRKLEKVNYLEQRKKFGYKPQTPSDLSNKPRVEDRLYEIAKEEAIRKEESLSIQRAALAAKSEGAWICPSCGITNESSEVTCNNPLKFGSILLASNQRVCGGGRPNSSHIPSISQYAHLKIRTSTAPNLPAAATIGVEQYRKEKLAREEQGRARIEAEVSSQSFKPSVSQRSSELADVARLRRLKALAEAQTLIPTIHPASTSLQDAAVERLAGLSSHELLYEDAMLRQRALSDSVADEIIARSGVARSEAELEEFFTRMHAHAAETRARIDASRKRLAEQEQKVIQSTRFRENKRTSSITSSLFDHVAQQQRNKEAAVSSAHIEAERMFRSRHTLKHSDSLLEKRREQCFAGVYIALLKSMQLSPAARADESAAQFAFERTIGGAPGSAGPTSVEAGIIQPQGTVITMSREDLAASLAALRIYSSEDGDGRIEEAQSGVLDLDAVWSSCLVQLQLVKLVDLALSHLRIQVSMKQQQNQRKLELDHLGRKTSQETDETLNQMPLEGSIALGGSESNPETAPRLANFQEFCACLGRILEKVGGGPQVYVLARRLGKKRDEVHLYPPQSLDKAQQHVHVHSAHTMDVGERLHAKESEYARVRIFREIDKLRTQFGDTEEGALPSFENKNDSTEAVRLLRKFSEQHRASLKTMNNFESYPATWLPQSIAIEAARNTEAAARQLGLHGMNYYASASNSRQGSPATVGSLIHPTQRSPQRDAHQRNGSIHNSPNPKSPHPIAQTFNSSEVNLPEENVSRLSTNSAIGGAFVMSPNMYQRVEDYGYTPTDASTDMLIHESGVLDKSLAKLSSISIQALNDRIERILRSPPPAVRK
jgi:hypothetical protein